MRSERLIEFQRYRNHDEKPRRAEYVYERRTAYRLKDKRRNERNDRKVYSTEKGYPVGYFAEIVRSRLTGTSAGDKTAVTLYALTYVVRIKLYLIIEIREEQYKQAQNYRVKITARTHIFVPPNVERTVVGG